MIGLSCLQSNLMDINELYLFKRLFTAADITSST